MEGSITAETIDYSKKYSVHSSYRYVRSSPIGGTSSSVALSLSSTIITNFELPNNCLNLSRSKIQFDVLFPNATANTIVNVDALGWSLFDRVQLATRTGTVLASSDNLNQFCHVMTKLRSNISVLTENANGALPTGFTVPTTTTASALYPYADIVKNNVLPVAELLRSSGVVIQPASLVTGGASTYNAIAPILYNNHRSNYRMDSTLNNTPIIEPLSVISQTLTATDLAVSYQLDLGTLYDTIMCLNKTLYFGDNLILTLQWAPTTRFTWLSRTTVTAGSGIDPVFANGATNTSTSAVNLGLNVTPADDWVAYTGAVVVSNLYLYTAIETNPITVSQIVNKVNTEGMDLSVPYIYNTKTAMTGSSSSLAIQQRITRQYGSRLLRCYNTLTPNATIPNFACTVGSAPLLNFHQSFMINGYNTSMDQIRLQDLTLSPTDGTSFLFHEYFLRNSCYLTAEQYFNQFFHIDSWTDKPTATDDDSVMDGYDLSTDKTYGINYSSLNTITSTARVAPTVALTTGATGASTLTQTIPTTFSISSVGGGGNYLHNLWFVCQRNLIIRGNQIMMQ